MSLPRLSDLSELERQISNLIIEVVVHRDIARLMEFTLQDLYDRKSLLDTEAEDPEATIRFYVYQLRDVRNQLENTNERGRFRLVEDELLYLHVKVQHVEIELEKARKELKGLK